VECISVRQSPRPPACVRRRALDTYSGPKRNLESILFLGFFHTLWSTTTAGMTFDLLGASSPNTSASCRLSRQKASRGGVLKTTLGTPFVERVAHCSQNFNPVGLSAPQLEQIMSRTQLVEQRFGVLQIRGINRDFRFEL
jgi:hypothetical protein